jgi:HlyD family secretion protein
MNLKKILIPIAALALLALILRFTVFRGRGDRDTIVASGSVEATEAQLGFQVPGRIDTIAVAEGDRVTAGQLLARLDVTELQARRAQAASTTPSATSRAPASCSRAAP